jgi:septum formation protein
LLSAGQLPLICPSNAEEDAWDADPLQQAQAIARQKLLALGADRLAALDPVALELPRLAADTLVVLDGQILGKPKDAGEAEHMLEALSGRTHRVITGVVLRQGHQEQAFAVSTEVSFRPLSAQDIGQYIASKEPFDKAGGYGIQGLGGALVHEVHGSYTNVIGLPLPQTLAALAALAAP